jgi:hypothetical protein
MEEEEEEEEEEEIKGKLPLKGVFTRSSFRPFST